MFLPATVCFTAYNWYFLLSIKKYAKALAQIFGRQMADSGKWNVSEQNHTYLDGPVVGGALDVPLEPLDVDDLGREPLQDDSDVLDRQVRRLLHRHLKRATHGSRS